MPLELEIKKILSEKSECVKCLDQHPLKPLILCSLYNGQITIWNYQTEKEINRFTVSELPVRAAKFIIEKKWVVTGSDDKQICIFNHNVEDKVHQFQAHSDCIRCIVVHPNEPCILSCGDDLLIKLWNWEKNWMCQQIFEGHTHFVMQVVFSPKDSNIFASASLDTTIKIWQLECSGPQLTLEGHEKGVNCVNYHNGEEPYLVSGADDNHVKIWNYQNKTCIQTLKGHSNNVTAVSYHPELPILISGSEDGTLKIWYVGSYKLEYTLKYNFDRVWTISVKRESNKVAIGYDQGMIMIKIGNEEPVISMDVCGPKIMWAINHRLQKVYLKQLKNSNNIIDGDPVRIARVKDLGSCEIYPQLIAYSPNGSYVTVCGSGEYIMYTSGDLKQIATGKAEEIVWGFDSSIYATLENPNIIRAYKSFKEVKNFSPKYGVANIFGGFMLGVKSKTRELISFYDWENYDLIGRIEFQPRHVYWSQDEKHVCLASDEIFYILSYDADSVALSKEINLNINADGIESAFKVINKEKEVVKSGFWVGDCFIYSNSLYKINYYIGGGAVNIANATGSVYVIGYVQNEHRLVVTDNNLNITSYFITSREFEFHTAMMRGNYNTAENLFYLVPFKNRFRLAYFLEKQGYKKMAMGLSPDPVQRFNIAISIGALNTAKYLAEESTLAEGGPSKISEERWARLGVAAAKAGETELIKLCYKKSRDYSSLLILGLCAGDKELLEEVAQKASEEGDDNMVFMAKFALSKLSESSEMLMFFKNIPEATIFAESCVPTRKKDVVELWNEMKDANKKQLDSLVDPVDCQNIYPEYLASLKAVMIQHAFGIDHQTLLNNILKEPIKKNRDEEIAAETEELERLGL